MNDGSLLKAAPGVDRDLRTIELNSQKAPHAQSRGEIVGIQYLRGIAAIAVVAAHTSNMANFEKYSGKEILGGFLSKGALGVDLFFLISGFIISIVSLMPGSLRPTKSFRDFLERRFARIIPLMWLAIVSYAVLRYSGRGIFDAGPYLRAFFLFPAGDVTPNAIWTLRHEFLFYLLFGASFLLAGNKKWILLAWFASSFVYSALSLPSAPETMLGQMARLVANPVNVEFAGGFLLGFIWLLKTNRFQFDSPISPILVLLGGFMGFTILGFALDLGVEQLYKTLISSSICFGILFVGVHVRCKPGWGDSLMQLFGARPLTRFIFSICTSSRLASASGRVLLMIRPSPWSSPGPSRSLFGSRSAYICGSSGHWLRQPDVSWGR